MAEEHRQVVRFWFLRLDPEWRRLPPSERAAHRAEFVSRVRSFRARMLLRTYSLMGTRGDADLLFWQAAPALESLQEFETAVFGTQLGCYLTTAYSYLSMTRRSDYRFPDFEEERDRTIIQPSDHKYLYVYPFVKTRAWYRLPQEERQDMMREHVAIGRRFPGVRVNTTYSFGLDDQEFVVTFENDDPAEFVDLVMELRGSAASAFTERDTPVLTCIQMSVWEVLDALGGAGEDREEPSARSGADDAWTCVAHERDFETTRARRVYLGRDAVALFRVGDRYYAVADRCSHGRASLSEGTVDEGACVLTCPWHDGRFALDSGHPVSGPPRAAIKTYEVRVRDGGVYVGAPNGGGVGMRHDATPTASGVGRRV